MAKRLVELSHREPGSAELGILAALRPCLHRERHGHHLGDLANLLFKAGNDAAAIEVYKRALMTLQAMIGGDHADVGAAWSVLGNSKLRAGNHGAALEAPERAVSVQQAALGDEHPDVGSAWDLASGHSDIGVTWCNIRVCRFRGGDYAGALDPLLTARGILLASLGPDDACLANC